MTRVQQIEEALAFLAQARRLLKAAKAPQATDYVRRAMKSVEGARRHAIRMDPATIWHPSADCPCNSCRGIGASNPDAIIVEIPQ